MWRFRICVLLGDFHFSSAPTHFQSLNFCLRTNVTLEIYVERNNNADNVCASDGGTTDMEINERDHISGTVFYVKIYHEYFLHIHSQANHMMRWHAYAFSDELAALLLAHQKNIHHILEQRAHIHTLAVCVCLFVYIVDGFSLYSVLCLAKLTSTSHKNWKMFDLHICEFIALYAQLLQWNFPLIHYQKCTEFNALRSYSI